MQFTTGQTDQMLCQIDIVKIIPVRLNRERGRRITGKHVCKSFFQTSEYQWPPLFGKILDQFPRCFLHLLRRAKWLHRQGVRWFPVVTFWQVSLDMVFSLDVPDGHGHAYGLDAVDLWAAILQPEGWDGQATARVRAALAESR